MNPEPVQNTKITPLMFSFLFHTTAMASLAAMCAFSTRLLLSAPPRTGFLAGVIFYIIVFAVSSLSEQ